MRSSSTRVVSLQLRRSTPALCRAVPTLHRRAFDFRWSLLPRRRAYHEVSAEQQGPQDGGSAARRVIDAVQRRFSAVGSSEEETTALPDAALVQEAIQHVGRNGYLAWPLYAHLRQGELPMSSDELAALAAAMLHVDHELHADKCVRRALTVVDHARSTGQADSLVLLAAASRACAVGGLPDRAEELCHEGMELTSIDPHGPAHVIRPLLSTTHWSMQGHLIRACGAARQLDRAFALYRRWDEPPQPQLGVLSVAMLRACENAADLDRGFALLREVRSRASSGADAPTAAMLVPLLRGCARAGELPRALKVADFARRHGIAIQSAAVHAFAVAGGAFLPHALEQYRHAREVGAPVSKASIAKLAAACLVASPKDAAPLLDDIEGGVDGALDVINNLTRQYNQQREAQNDPRTSHPSRRPESSWPWD